jgi:hypothetical protein
MTQQRRNSDQRQPRELVLKRVYGGTAAARRCTSREKQVI